MDFANIICVFLSTLLLHPSLGQDGAAADNEALSFSVKISPDTQDQLVQLGTNRIFTCTSSSSNITQKPVLHWEINDVKVTATSSENRIRLESITGDGLRLRVENTMNGDEGTYKCVGTLGVQTDSRTVRVEIYDTVKIHPEPNQFGILGQTGIVVCNATGNPKPVLSWLFENLTAIEDATGEKFVVQGIQLVIKDLQFSDARKYICDASVTRTGENEKSTINFEVIKVPVIEEEPVIRPINPKAGTEVTVTCQADGVPKPTYQYKKGDIILSDDQFDAVNGILTLTDLKQEDEATYACVATNRGGSVEKTFFLDVKIPPSIQEMPENTEAVEGDTHQLKCLAEGDPSPSVTWQRLGGDVYVLGAPVDGVEVIEERDDISNAAGKILSFTSVKPQDAGDYICTAVSDVDSASRTITLDVKYKPHFDTDFKETDFYGWDTHTANLTCLVSANELATVKWFKISTDGDTDPVPISNEDPAYVVNPIQNWPELHLSSSSILVPVRDDKRVYGDYQCEAQNSLGVTTYTVKLIEAVTPEAPKASVINAWSTMVTVDVQAPDNNGGQPVTGYTIRYHDANDSSKAEEKFVEALSDTTVIELRNLVSKTSYLGTVTAHNVVGAGKEFPLSFDTKEVSEPLKLNVTSPRVGSEPTSYEVSWSEPDNGGSVITQFLIKYREVSVLDKSADEWQIDSSADNQFTEIPISDANARSYIISNLKRDEFYEIRISATNKEGSSQEEIRVVKTSEGSEVKAGQAEDGDEDEDKEEENGDMGDAEFYNNKNVDVVEDKKSGGEGGEAGGSLGRNSQSDKKASAGLGSGTVIGIVIGLLIVIVIIAVIVSLVLKKKPELVGRLRGLGGKGGEEERGKGDDGKDPAEEEKLIKKDDTVKVENEIEEGKPEQVMEEQHEEFEPDSKPEAPTSPEVGAKNGTAEKPPELATPAATTEIKITPETPEKPEDPPA